MRKSILFLCFLFPFVVFAKFSHQDSIKYYNQILKVDSIPVDEKKIILQDAIKYAKHIQDVYAALDYQVQYGEYLLDLREYDASRQTLKVALKQIETLVNTHKSERWQNLHIQALYVLGFSEIFAGDGERAMTLFNKMVALYGQDSNSVCVAKAYNGVGIVFGFRGEKKIAMDYFKKSLEIYKKNGDLRGQAGVYSNLGGAFLGIDEDREALKCFVEVYKIVASEKYQGKDLIHSNFNLALIYAKIKKYELSEQYFTEVLKIAKKQRAYHLIAYIQHNYAYILYEQGLYNKAQKINAELINDSNNLQKDIVKIKALQLESNILEKQGNYKGAILFLRKSYTLLDSLQSKENEEKMVSLRYQFDNYKMMQEKKLKEKNLELAEKKIAYRNLWIACLSILFIISVSGLFVALQRIVKQYKVNKMIKIELLTSKDKEESRVQGLKEHFDEELNNKNKELTSNALMFLKFSELTINIREKIKLLNIHFSLKSKEKEIITSIEQLLKEFSPTKDWTEFKLCFEQVNGTFFLKLGEMYPNLTPNDLRLCALISMNLSAKEIASLTCRTFRSVCTAKFRLKKKMNLPPEANLYEFFRDL